MAHGGTRTPPKPDDQRRRRNAPASGPERELVDDGVVRGPSIEEATCVPEDQWLPQTLQWWETWRSSPQAQIFEATDWQRLAMLAQLVDTFWSDAARVPRHLILGEIRQNEERLGATYIDRQRARLRVTRPGEAGAQPAAAATVTRMADFKARLEAGA